MSLPSIDTSFLIEPDALRTAGVSPLLIDTRTPGRYAEGRLPGAINLSSYDRFIQSTSPIGLNRFHRQMAIFYGEAGVTMSRPIVVYEDQTGMRAARECWMLQYLGHPDVRMLHGGLHAWLLAGEEMGAEGEGLRPDVFTPEPQTEMIIGVNGILTQAGMPHLTLLDVRKYDEYTGTGGSPCCVRQGRLPGAVRVEWTTFVDETTGRFKSPDVIRQILNDHDIDPENKIVTYCHRGARSAAVYYALRYAGYTQVRNFIGSWHEWAARNDLPIESGV